MWEARTGAGGQVSWVLFSLRLALLKYSNPFYKEYQERLFTEATICMAQSGDAGSKGDAGRGAGREWRSPAVDGRQLSCLQGGLGSTASSQPHSCLLFPGCGHQDRWRQVSSARTGLDAHFVYSSSFSILRQDPWDEGEGKGGTLCQASSGVLLALLLCSQLGQHGSCGSTGTVCGACRERARSRGPLWVLL